jgi:hypothetical protein
MITQEYLKSAVEYNPETGEFFWKYRKDMPKQWNSVWAGKKVKGRKCKQGYLDIRICNKRYGAHRLAFLYMHGWLPKEVDHKNCHGPKDDNRIQNLRNATRMQNENNKGIKKNNTSGFKGVCWHKSAGKWMSRIRVGSKRINLGLFDCPAAASFSYQVASNIYHGDFGRVA